MNMLVEIFIVKKKRAKPSGSISCREEPSDREKSWFLMVYNLYSGSIVWQQPTSDIRSISHYPLPHRFILFFIQIFFLCVSRIERSPTISQRITSLSLRPQTRSKWTNAGGAHNWLFNKNKQKKWLSTAISERHKSSRYVYDMEMSFR